MFIVKKNNRDLSMYLIPFIKIQLIIKVMVITITYPTSIPYIPA